jgi:AcrR family transcriptional regulator
MARVTKPVEERRREIVDTARALFVENGFDKTQVADISKRMHVAQGLIYHYFQSKTEILDAVLDQLAEEQLKRIKDTLAGRDCSALDALVFLFRDRPSPDDLGKLPLSLLGDPALIDYCNKKMIVSVTPLLLSLIERGNADGSWNCTYPQETAMFIMQGFSGIIRFEIPEEPPDEESSKSPAFKDIILRLLGAGSSDRQEQERT